MNVSPELSFTHKDPAYDQFHGARKLYLKRKWKLISTTLVASLCSIQAQLFPTYIRRKMKQMLITCHMAVNNPQTSPARGFPSCHAKLFSFGSLHFSLELDRSLRGSRQLVFLVSFNRSRAQVLEISPIIEFGEVLSRLAWCP